MKTWALTGAGGYIGRHLAAHLVARGATVRGLYHSSAPAPRIEPVTGNVLEPDVVARLVDGADVVVHLAAFVHRRAGSDAQQSACRQLNVDGTRIVAEASRRANAFLVDVSTANVYPPQVTPADERSPTEPRTLYGQTKLAAEDVVASERGLRAVIVRPAMVFGPNAPGNLPRLVRAVRRGIVPILGDGKNKKTLTSVERLSQAIIALAEHPSDATGQVFNVGGLTLSMHEIIETIAGELGRTARVVTVPFGPMHLFARGLDRATRGLGWPSFAQMVESFASSSELDDAKLSAFPGFRDSSDLMSDFRGAVRSFSGSR